MAPKGKQQAQLKVPSLAEQEAIQRHSMASVDKMAAGRPPAPLRRKLEGPFWQMLDHDPPVVLQYGFSPAGRLICTGLLIGWTEGPMSDRVEITARAVRQVRVGEILADLFSDPDNDPPTSRARKTAPLPNWARLQAPVIRPPHPGGAGHTDEHFVQVAEVYKTALVEAPGSPMQWLAEQFGISSATAYRWRDEAAARGLLPQREKTRRGPARERQRSTTRRKGTRR